MTREMFVKRSLDCNIFYLRVLKDFIIVAANGLSTSGQKYIQPLERFRFHCEMLLKECLDTGSGLVNDNLRHCRALISEFTEESEAKSQAITGYSLNTKLNKIHSVLNSRPVAVKAGKLPDVYRDVKLINTRAAELNQDIYDLFDEITGLRLDGKLFCHCFPSAYALFLRTSKRYGQELKDIKNDIINQATIAQKAGIISGCINAVLGFIDPSQDAELTIAKNLLVKLNNYDIEIFTEGFSSVAHSCERYFITLTQNVLSGKILSVMLPLLPDCLLRIIRRTITDCEY